MLILLPSWNTCLLTLAALPPGPAVGRGMKALVALAPHTAATQTAAEVLAKALACPDAPAKRLCSSRTITNFFCLFLADDVPEACKVGGSAAALSPHARRRLQCGTAAGARLRHALMGS
jgi:hypothetical protein